MSEIIKTIGAAGGVLIIITLLFTGGSIAKAYYDYKKDCVCNAFDKPRSEHDHEAAATVANEPTDEQQQMSLWHTLEDVSILPTDKPKKKKRGRKSAEEKHKEAQAYIQKYHHVAGVEMDEYGIPASIKLAQGILESARGTSSLAEQNKNHFGIKCFSKTCKRGHCSNFEDDDHKDFFRIYRSAEQSYREHSIFLQKPRYERLFRLDKKDYKAWAHGLKACGYATDPNYAPKLISIIETYNLDNFDDI